jgi:tetratricopeptide (TPR) repeat protein
MTINSNTIILYLKDALDSTEKAAFETALQQDTDLQEQVAVCRNLLAFEEEETANREEVATLKETLAAIHPQYFSQATGEKKETKVIGMQSWKKWAMSAAAAVIIIVAGYSVFYSGNNLMDTYGHIDTVGLVERGNEANDETRLVKAIQDKEYETALPLAKTLTNQQPDRPLYQFYYGAALLHTKNYPESVNWLQKAVAAKALFSDKAAILLALAYNKLDDKTAAVTVLNTIQSTSDEYKNAQKLLEKIK